MCGKLIVCDVIWHLPQVFYSVWETDCMRCYLASPSSFFILCGKLIVCDVIWHLPQVF